MGWSFRLFRVQGIDVKVHVTFVLILVWAAYTWSNSTGEGVQGALFGVVATLLLFGSVLLHEMAHSLQAIKYGMRVRDITLLPIGGVSQMDEMPEKPGQELRITIAGPLVNFAIAALLIVIGGVLNARSVVTVDELISSLGKANWQGMLAYLTMANLGLGLFNLIPAFPMDGGRVLRSLLSMAMDHTRATALAVSIGQGLALLLGLLGFLGGNYFLVLIAIFIWMGAGAEGKQVEVKSVLREIRVGQAMTHQPQTLLPDDPLGRAVELTLSTAQADFPVIRDGQLVGLLTQGDLLQGLQAPGETPPVSQVMRTQYLTARPDDPLFQAQQAMAGARVSALPVVDETGRLVGSLSITDVSEAYRLLSASPNLTLKGAVPSPGIGSVATRLRSDHRGE